MASKAKMGEMSNPPRFGNSRRKGRSAGSLMPLMSRAAGW